MNEAADPDERARKIAREHRDEAAAVADREGPGGDIAEAILQIADRTGGDR